MATYYCSTHPQCSKDGPGKCPKCNQQLKQDTSTFVIGGGSPSSQVTAYLKTLKVLRVVFVASANFGHYACTVGIMRRLVALGFTGLFDLIIDERANGENAQSRVKTLLPQFTQVTKNLSTNDANGFVFEGCRAVCRVLDRDGQIGGADPEPVPLGITGGIDTNEGRDIANDVLGVSSFIKLQPYKWAKGAYEICFPDRKVDLREKYASSHFDKRTFYLPDPSLDDLGDSHNGLLATIKYICAEAMGRRINFAPVYGIHTWTNPIQVLANYVLGILCLQKMNAPEDIARFPMRALSWESTRKRKAVVVVLGDWTEKYKELSYKNRPPMELFSKYLFEGDNYSAVSVLTKPGDKFTEFCTAQKCSKRVIVMDERNITLKSVKDTVKDMADDQVLVLYLGKVPQTVFNVIFGCTRELPAVFEGQNTVEVALNLGKRYLQVKHQDGYPSLPLGSVEVPSFRASWGRLCQEIGLMAGHNIISWKPDRNGQFAPQLLADFMSECMDGGGDAARYFESLREFFHQENNGKLDLALRIFIRELYEGADWGTGLSKYYRAAWTGERL